MSRSCKAIDDDGAGLRGRRLDHQPFPYIWLDATYVHVREHGQVVSKSVVSATGVRADGHREVLGVDVGLCGLVDGDRPRLRRGSGVRLGCGWLWASR